MVFKRFWRAEEKPSASKRAVWVWKLAVVKEIVDRHGGWVQVEGKKGEAPALPSTFRFSDEERIRAQKERPIRKNAGAKARGGKKKGRN